MDATVVPGEHMGGVRSSMSSRGQAEAEKAVIPDTAHVLNMERPEGFNRLVLDFLERHAPL